MVCYFLFFSYFFPYPVSPQGVLNQGYFASPQDLPPTCGHWPWTFVTVTVLAWDCCYCPLACRGQGAAEQPLIHRRPSWPNPHRTIRPQRLTEEDLPSRHGKSSYNRALLYQNPAAASPPPAIVCAYLHCRKGAAHSCQEGRNPWASLLVPVCPVVTQVSTLGANRNR